MFYHTAVLRPLTRLWRLGLVVCTVSLLNCAWVFVKITEEAIDLHLHTERHKFGNCCIARQTVIFCHLQSGIHVFAFANMHPTCL